MRIMDLRRGALALGVAIVLVWPNASFAQISPLCEGDANGDGIVNFADITTVLGNWLNDYTPLTGPGDANLSGVVDFADLTSVLGHWLEQCEVVLRGLATPAPGQAGELSLSRPNANDLIVPAKYRIKFGAQQLDQGLITLESFSIVAQAPDLGAGLAPPVIVSFWIDPSYQAPVIANQFEIPIRMSSASAFIDRAMPPLQEGEGTFDGGLGFVEIFDGVLRGQIVNDPANNRRLIELDANMVLSPAHTISGVFSSYRIAVICPCLNIFGPLSSPCSATDFRILRQLKIRPVLYRINPGQVAGESLDNLKTAARRIWLKCCIDLVFLDPIILDAPSDVDIKNVTPDQLEDLLAVDSDPDALEIIFVDGFDPPTEHGGARVNKVGRGADGRAIISDSCADGSAMDCNDNTNVMAHEIGHIMGLCHPGCDGCPDETPAKGGDAGFNQGTASTVMEPSGAAADNPPENSVNNCDNACNALMTTRAVLCCRRPEL